MNRPQKICLGVSISLCVLAVVVAIVGPMFISSKLQQGVLQQVIVDSENAPGYQSWQNNTGPNDPPLWLKFYIFNVTNPDGVLEGEKPNLVEIGPYSYRKLTVNFNVSFQDDGNERQFRSWKYYKFDPENSFKGASPNDTLTVINVPFQGVIGSLFYKDFSSRWWKSLLFDVLASYSNSSLFTTVAVEGLIFGYEDPLLAVVSALQPSTSPIFRIQLNQTSMDTTYNTTLPTAVYTGKKDLSQLGVYKFYEGKAEESCWGSDTANQIRGNDATAFYPGVSINDQLPVFVSDIFRSSNLVASETLEYMGITLYNFGISKTDMQNVTENPDNAAYYQFGPSGILNLTGCNNGAQIFMSKPHFLGADPFYTSQINGLDPNVDRHDTVIAVEPTSGVTMLAHKRLQINVKLQEDMLLFPNLRKNLYFPLAWIDETGTITEDLANQFKGSVYLVQTIIVAVQWGAIGLSIVLFGVSIILGVVFYRSAQLRRGYAVVGTNNDDPPLIE